MKAIAYAMFVVSVLLISGFARADVMLPFVQTAVYQVPVEIEQVSVDNTQGLLRFDGNLPNPCYQQPSAALVQDVNEPNTLILRLSSPLPTEMCVQRIKPYSTIVDLVALARASHLALEEQAVYVIKTEGYDFKLQVVGADLIK